MAAKERVWEAYDRRDGLPGYRKVYARGLEVQVLCTPAEPLPDDTEYDGRPVYWSAWFLKQGRRMLVMSNYADGEPFPASHLVRGFADAFVERHRENWPAPLKKDPLPKDWHGCVFPPVNRRGQGVLV